MNTCTHDNCDKPRKGHGLCAAHYKAMRRAADPTYNRYPVECVTCSKTFHSPRKTGKLCSDECRSIAYTQPKSVCTLPSDHPVRLVMRQAQDARKAARATTWKQ